MAGNPASNIDAYVGSRVRLRRMGLGMSQQRLGDELGVTFQQVQKYEKGVNRITAGRLYHIATLLAVEVDYFFQSPSDPGVTPQPDLGSCTLEDAILEFLNTRDGLELNRAFRAISDPAQRRAVIDVIRAISGSHSRGG